MKILKTMIIPLSTAIIVSNALAGTIDRNYNGSHLELLNKYREANGKSTLVLDVDLVKAAEKRAYETSLYWAHYRPNDYLPYSITIDDMIPKDDSKGFLSTFENIGYNGSTNPNGQDMLNDIINRWKNSAGHSANMLRDGVNAFGVGLYRADNGTWFWVELFGNTHDLRKVEEQYYSDPFHDNENLSGSTITITKDNVDTSYPKVGVYASTGMLGPNWPAPKPVEPTEEDLAKRQNINAFSENNTNGGGGVPDSTNGNSQQQTQTNPNKDNTSDGDGTNTDKNQNQNNNNSNTNTPSKPTQKPSTDKTDKEESKEENKPTTPSKPSQSEKDKAEQERLEAQKAEQERLEAQEKARQEAEQKAAEEKAKQEAEEKAKEEAMKAVVVAMMAEEIRQSNPQFKALSEGTISAVTTVLAAADTAATSGMDEASKATSANAATLGAGQTAMAAFGATGGGSMRYKSGSHVDVKGVNVLAGVGFSREFNEGKIMIAPFVEAGWSKYNTYNSFNNAASVEGDGDSSFVGFGALLRYDISGASHPYIEASVRAGELKNKYNAGSVYDRLGRVLEYTTHTPYFSAHVGAGYIFDLGDGLSLDLGAKYLYTHVKSDKVNVAGDKFSFGAVNSHRLRASAKVEKELNESVSIYGGMAYEYEFKGSANASINGRTIKAPSIKGGSGMAEVGFGWYLTKNVRLDISAQGWVGKKQGVNGNIGIKINF